MEFELQRLEPGMMARYEIEAHRPTRVNAIEFGMSEMMLGTVNRLLDASGPDIGVACVEAGETGYAERLNRQGGLYTVVVRGYAGETAVRREIVVQCVLNAHEAGDLDDLARDANIGFGFVDDTDAARALAARFVEMRREAGLKDIALFALGENALADSLVFRSEADEAARQCREMNYLDDMLFFAEPHARLTLTAPQSFPLECPEGICFCEPAEFEAEARLKAQLFDAGVFLMAAPGWLNGCDTLSDCMNHECLRRFVGEGFTEELMPALADMDRAIVERRVIECFERYENPLNRNRVLRAAENLLSRFMRGALPIMRRVAETDFEPPRRLSFALAATIMLYAGARLNPETGVWEVMRGKTAEALHDDPAKLEIFSTLSHDMPPETLAYAVLADRELWGGLDLRDIDGLEARVALDIAAMQRAPGYLPGE